MKIVVISAEYPPFFAGGIALNVFDLNQHMNKENDIITLTFSDNIEPIVSQREETRLISIPIPKTCNKLCYEDKYCIQNDIFIEEIKKYENELVGVGLIVLHGYFLSCLACYIKEKYDIPLLYYLHTMYTTRIDDELDKISHDEIEILKSSAAIICVSQYLLNEADKIFPIYNKTAVIGKAVELDYVDNKKYYMNDNSYLFVGRMSEEKGFEILLKAFQKYLEKNENAVLHCIGTFVDEKYREKIQKYCKSYKTLQRHIIFLGSKDRAEIYQYMRMSNVVIIPSFMETFGKVAIEAMANKSLVIAADVGGLGSLVLDGITGLKFKVGDANDLYVQLCKVTAINRLEIVESAYSFVNKEFSYNNIKCKSNQFIYKQLHIEEFYK